MPVLKRLDGQGNESQRSPNREPDVIHGRPGHPSFSWAALMERVEVQFEAETANRPDILLEEQDEAARRTLVREVAEYVIAVESVPLTYAEKEKLVDAVYRNLFGFGPLDALLADETTVEMTIDGHANVHIRRWQGNLESVPSPFEDVYHLARTIDRFLTGSDAQLLDTEPFIEVGLTILKRPARLNLVVPPFSPMLYLELRLHPRQAITLEALREQGVLTGVDLAVLHALIQSPHGVLIVGDAAAGKTTLLRALLLHLPEPSTACLVERAREIHPPEGITSLAAIPARTDRAGQDFAAQIAAALAQAPATLILDELRGDEARPVLAALTADEGPRCLFALRSSPNPKRLWNAFGILIRKGQAGLDQALINQALQERLPFVVTTQIDAHGMCVIGIGEWGEDRNSGDVMLVPLVRDGKVTGNHPRHALQIEDAFWVGAS